jgi:MFS family permease
MATAETIEARANASVAMTARQRLIAVLLLGTNFMLSVDFSILNVALPEVGRAVGLGHADFPWVTTAFALPAAGLSLLFGRLGDIYGRRRLFVAGLALLALASLMGGIANGPLLLLGARALQGIATAMTAPAARALLITAFADDKQRARVLGLNGTLLSGGFAVGALAGGLLVDVLSWRWALPEVGRAVGLALASFLINVPFAIAILVLTPFVVPAGRPLEKVRLDIPGATSVTLGLLAFVFGIVEWFVPALIAGLALLALFFRIERRAMAPWSRSRCSRGHRCAGATSLRSPSFRWKRAWLS